MVPVHNGWLWFPKNPGLVSGIILAGFGLGPFVCNFIATHLINPWGDPVNDDLQYPARVNDRFEFMMRILGLIYFGSVCVGLIFIFKGPLAENK